jgi:hypothetical protein
MRLILVLWSIWTAGAAGAAEVVDFYAHWGDGKAELSSYDVVQPRYGELRQGYGVMIFVTEDINRDTFIKVESPTPKEQRLYVLKFNNVLKFTTGIYDYSVMTSVFSEVEGPEHSFVLRKISLSAQEWCGHVFDEVQLRDGRLNGSLNSYFEREGRRDYTLAVEGDFASEDHLLIRLRELKGQVLAPGESMQVKLLPSLWSLRTAHGEHQLQTAQIHKGQAEEVQLASGAIAAYPWTIETARGMRKLWIEQAYPHRILQWEDSDGGRGELKKTIRVPYWSLHSQVDEVYRKELGLP